MAMYYYATKLSAVACGTRCRQGLARRQRSNRAHRQQPGQPGGGGSGGAGGSGSGGGSGSKKDDDEDSDDNSKDKKTLSSFFCESTNDTIVVSVKSSEQPEVYCESMPPLAHEGSLGTGGVMYGNGTIVSGPLASLIDLLMPSSVEEFDQEYVFSFLLSARFFVRSFELMGKLLESIPDPEPLERIVPLLGVWTKMFPYDFRDERMMNHVKHIVARCADTDLASVVSQLLCALLARLTQLENHEEELKSYQSTVDNKTESITWPKTAAQLAQLLCRIERKLAKHVGPEEFVQCSPNLLKDPNREDFPTPVPPQSSATGSGPGGTSLDSKKTCNLESYLEWSARLRLLVANEILKCQNIQDRNKQFELWSGAAQYCLLVGNYNSATAILESFDLPPVARLQVTWSKLSTTTSQQLDCMQRHAEGCGNLWSKQTEQQQHLPSGGTDRRRSALKAPSSGSSSGSSGFPKPSTGSVSRSSSNSNEWVVIPVFVDIIKLALKAREDCCVRLPNGHINMTAFDRLAAIVGAFTRHMNQVNQTLPDVGEYAILCQFMQSCKLLNETELMLASFECEAPTLAEKELYDVA
ncbi:ras-GEF domain-containing family member 1B [Anopheles cruzii]|uniref:ras-GEF domain-containing family member 1B n=1 Tax=Anopheles cruzii TaxID=68878 RepID=UPI0022EC257A|nr:ras-GEF domain-containing family member 1B [Anopheles cruzii]